MNEEKTHYIDDTGFVTDSYSETVDYFEQLDNISIKSKENPLYVTHKWTKGEYWKIYDLEKKVPFLNQIDISVSAAGYVHSKFEKDKEKRTDFPIMTEVEEKVKDFYPEDIRIRNKCGDMSSLLSQFICNEYGFMPNIVRGLLSVVDSGEYSHSFIELTPDMVRDINKPHIIDGTAKQFNNGPIYDNFEKNLVFVTPDHKHYDKYIRKHEAYYVQDW